MILMLRFAVALKLVWFDLGWCFWYFRVLCFVNMLFSLFCVLINLGGFRMLIYLVTGCVWVVLCILLN